MSLCVGLAVAQSFLTSPSNQIGTNNQHEDLRVHIAEFLFSVLESVLDFMQEFVTTFMNSV
jgi:hypothetical protein